MTPGGEWPGVLYYTPRLLLRRTRSKPFHDADRAVRPGVFANLILRDVAVRVAAGKQIALKTAVVFAAP